MTEYIAVPSTCLRTLTGSYDRAPDIRLKELAVSPGSFPFSNCLNKPKQSKQSHPMGLNPFVWIPCGPSCEQCLKTAFGEYGLKCFALLLGGEPERSLGR